jgi:hypothetical protein
LRYEVVLRPRAITVLDALNDFDRRAVLALIDQIRLDPSPDERHRYILHVPPAVLTVLAQNGFWIVYHLIGGTVSVLNIGRDPQEPRHN